MNFIYIDKNPKSGSLVMLKAADFKDVESYLQVDQCSYRFLIVGLAQSK